ncbi:TraK family protein [Xenorhabdus bovienii]|uniref:TraK family protein n=1 Tax=Xenorhabdus bovienii TaxID=40576 RepID=UPI0021585B95|nr:TraK family protein [Xenorhabdus bovienii]
MGEQPCKTYRGQGRVTFLAHIDTFRTLLDAGHPLKAIYDDYRDRLQIGYPQFTKYVNRYIRKTENDGHQKKEGNGEEQATGAKNAQNAKANRPGFRHDPNSGNTRDDLI